MVITILGWCLNGTVGRCVASRAGLAALYPMEGQDLPRRHRHCSQRAAAAGNPGFSHQSPCRGTGSTHSPGQRGRCSLGALPWRLARVCNPEISRQLVLHLPPRERTRWSSAGSPHMLLAAPPPPQPPSCLSKSCLDPCGSLCWDLSQNTQSIPLGRATAGSCLELRAPALASRDEPLQEKLLDAVPGCMEHQEPQIPAHRTLSRCWQPRHRYSSRGVYPAALGECRGVIAGLSSRCHTQ